MLRNFLAIGPRWKTLEKRWGTRTASQLKNRWYQVACGHTARQHHALATTLEQARKGLPVPQLK
jgi:hypothetical protein